MAQIAADATELPYEKIAIKHGSTSDVKNGYGAYHSRSTVMGGSAILLAAGKLKERIREAAAMRLGCAASDVVIDGEQVAHGGKMLELAGLYGGPLEVETAVFHKKYTLGYGTPAGPHATG